MKKLFTTKKRIAAAGAAAAIVLGVAGGAFAFITGGSGSGTGTASVTPSVTLDNLTATATTGAMTPGGATQATTVKVTDPNTYSVKFGRISIALDTNSADWPASCPMSDSSWFVVGSDTTVGYVATPGSSNSYTGPTVKMLDDTSNDQTSCLGAAIPLVVTLSAS